jgi:hypothetical protein
LFRSSLGIQSHQRGAATAKRLATPVPRRVTATEPVFFALLVITDQAIQRLSAIMRADFAALLPLAAAAGLVMGGGDARAIMIRSL